MAGKSHTGFVIEFLEKVSGKLLEEERYRQVIARMIRGHAGIYALYKGDRLYYVGLATNLMGRVKQHLKDRHARRWDKFSVYLASSNDHIKPLESLLLRIALPPGNRVKGRLPGAVDKRSTLQKAMRDHDAMRYASLLGGNVARRQIRKATASAHGTRVLKGRLEKRIQLRAEYKGQRYRASLLKDGHISYAGDKYPSPTAAARAIVGRNVNGWRFWHYQKSRLGWIPLADLRK